MSKWIDEYVKQTQLIDQADQGRLKPYHSHDFVDRLPLFGHLRLKTFFYSGLLREGEENF